MTTRVDLLRKLEELMDLVLLLPDDGSVKPPDPDIVIPPPEPDYPPVQNFAEDYGVGVMEAPRPANTKPYWRCTYIRHLIPGENRGGHAIYVIVVDEYGNRVYDPDLRIGWTWEGRNPNQDAPPQKLDKPDGLIEKGHGNVDLYHGMTVHVWIESARDRRRYRSDIATGFHSKHPDEPGPNGERWNSIGHHSFIVKFQLVN